MSYEDRALAWLLRLPLIDEIALVNLCGGINRHELHRSLEALRAGGWLLQLTLDDPECDDVVRYAASSAARAWVREQQTDALARLGSLPTWQLSDAAVCRALASGPVSQQVHHALSAVAFAAEQARDGRIVQAALRAPPRQSGMFVGDPRPPLRFGHAEARWVRDDHTEARFAVHIDRRTVSPRLRRALFARWQRLVREGGREQSAALLVVCPSRNELDQWIAIYEAALARHPPDALPFVALGLAREVLDEEPLYALTDSVWHNPGAPAGPHHLLGVLHWADATADEPLCWADEDGHLDGVSQLAPPAAARRALQEVPRGASLARQVGAAVLALDAHQLASFKLLMSQSWLAVEDLARIRGESPELLERRVAGLVEAGLLDGVVDAGGVPRLVLRDAGLFLAAARAGFAGRQVVWGEGLGVRWWPDGEDAPHPSRHIAGISRTYGHAVAAARDCGLTWAGWCDERLWRREISREAPVPDAMFAVQRNGAATVHVLVEYEQALHHDAAAKVGGWIDWYQGQRWRPFFMRAPLLLIVHGSPDRPEARPGLLWRGIGDAPPWLPAFGASERELATNGFSGNWHRAGGGFGSPADWLHEQFDAADPG